MSTRPDLIVIIRDVERRPFRIDLDHGAVRVAARCHEGALQRPERIALSAHQLGEYLGDVLRLTRRYRYVVDHCTQALHSDEKGPRCPSGLAQDATR
jgi:hypothetical protein